MIAASKDASNRMVDIEDLTEKNSTKTAPVFCNIGTNDQNEINIHQSHSIDAANKNHIKEVESIAISA